jgi:dipeptidyl aminopeptidase/acylaminoacyl peptidase
VSAAAEQPVDEPAWIRRFRAARVSLPVWARQHPSRACYATNASGVFQVVSWDLDTDEAVQLTDKPTGVIGGRPTPDGQWVVWFDDHAGDEVGRYVAQPFPGGPPAPLLADAPQGWSAGLSLMPSRWALGVATKEGFVVGTAEPEGAFGVCYRHDQPAGVGGLSRDGALLAISHTEHGDALHPSLKIADAVDGEVVAEVHDGPGNTVAPAGWSPVAGDARLALLCDRSGRTRPEVLSVEDGSRRVLDVEALPGEVWVADWWPDADVLLLGHDHLGRTELVRYDLSTDGLAPLDLTEGTIRGARVRPDGEVWYAFNSSATPSQIRRRSTDGADAVLLTPPGEPPPPGVAYRSLHVDNGEGGRVHAFVAEPEGVARGAPTVVDVHGGPHAQTTDSFDPQVQAWVDHGFVVAMPNYRGSTGYGKAWEDAVQGDPGRPELIDCRAVADRLVADGVADPERVVLTGASWGGYLTLQGLGTMPEAWSVGVAEVPVADYPRAYADESPVLREFDRSLFGGSPEELPQLYAERSPLSHVERVHAPVLIITGANDTRCPKQQVDNYVAALTDRGIPCAYEVYEAGHGSLVIDITIRHVGLALDFAARHLGTPPAQR